MTINIYSPTDLHLPASSEGEAIDYERYWTPFIDDRSEKSMAYAEPENSRGSVGRAGEELIHPSSPEAYAEALAIASNWRASHTYPLKSITGALRYQARKLPQEVTIGYRLKRLESIKGKLQRFVSMKLHRMQDIGGCRAIVPSIEDVYKLHSSMKSDRLGSELIKENDYIKDPKQSGYRGIHLIYKYRKKRKQSVYNGLFIEVQIRSAIQHAWATSVEIAGTFVGESLKSGEGSSDWLNFFELVSILFADVERCSSSKENSETIKEAKKRVEILNRRLSALDQLRAFSVVIKEADDTRFKKGCFLLLLNIDKKVVYVTHYSSKSINKATRDYIDLEEKCKNENINIVLVAVESLAALKNAYPNYFADSRMFIQLLESILSSPPQPPQDVDQRGPIASQGTLSLSAALRPGQSIEPRYKD